jgi:hypothetical protein
MCTSANGLIGSACNRAGKPDLPKMKYLTKRAGATAARALSMLILTLGAGSVAAGATSAGGVPSVPGYRVLYPVYLYPGACLSYGACAVSGWADRRPWRRSVAPQSESPAIDPDIWGTTGSPWGYVRRMPPPTPENQIQPLYKDASTVRPEFGGP